MTASQKARKNSSFALLLAPSAFIHKDYSCNKSNDANDSMTAVHQN
jgi:hypothetical protein